VTDRGSLERIEREGLLRVRGGREDRRQRERGQDASGDPRPATGGAVTGRATERAHGRIARRRKSGSSVRRRAMKSSHRTPSVSSMNESSGRAANG